MKSKEHAFGINIATSLLSHAPKRIERIYLDEHKKSNRLTQLIESAKNNKVKINFCSTKEFEQLLNQFQIDAQSVHQGVITAFAPAELRDEKWLINELAHMDAPFLLALDGVTDPHNLGACLRSANAAGVDAVIVPKDKSVSLTPAVRKVASGAAEITPLVSVKNLVRCVEKIQQHNVWVMGAAGEARQSLFDLDLKGGLLIVMGAEGAGLRRLTRESCDHLFKIPMPGEVESLNVSVAAGICLFEALRQRIN